MRPLRGLQETRVATREESGKSLLHFEPLSHLPTHPIPLGCPRVLALGLSLILPLSWRVGGRLENEPWSVWEQAPTAWSPIPPPTLHPACQLLRGASLLLHSV